MSRLHFIWDYEKESGICWCGENHADDEGNDGPIPDDQWVPISDPRARKALGDLYLEAWLSVNGESK